MEEIERHLIAPKKPTWAGFKAWAKRNFPEEMVENILWGNHLNPRDSTGSRGEWSQMKTEFGEKGQILSLLFSEGYPGRYKMILEFSGYDDGGSYYGYWWDSGA